jgi:hypothetical protein
MNRLVARLGAIIAIHVATIAWATNYSWNVLIYAFFDSAPSWLWAASY